MPEKQEGHLSDFSAMMIIGLFIALLVIGGSILIYYVDIRFQAARDQTLQDIEEKTNVSMDYRQGWLDAVNQINKWYHTPFNCSV